MSSPAAQVRAPALGVRARRARRTGSSFRWIALAPLLVFVAAFAVYPMIELVRMSLSRVDLQGGQFGYVSAGLANFRREAASPLFWSSVQRSVVFIVLTTLITVVAGTALALLTDRAVATRRLAQNVLLWPAVIAPVVISAMWLLILSPQIGLLNKLAALAGSGGQQWLGSPTGAFASIVAVDVWHWTPVVYLLVYTAMKGIDPSIIEAARVDGAGEGALTRHIVLPLLLPAVAAAAAVRVVMGVKVFDEMYLLTRGGPGTSTMVISLYIRQEFFDQLHFGQGAAASVMVVVGVLLAAALVAVGRRVAR